MKVSFIIIAYNAEKYLPNLLEDLKKQTYSKEKIEIILVDGISTDNTKNIMLEFLDKNKNLYENIVVLDNRKKTLPCGWNIALKAMTGDIVLRVDAHTKIQKDFIENNVKHIKSGEKICGGKVESLSEEKDDFSNILLIAENSAMGGGIAKFRRGTEKKHVGTLAFAAYSRDVFDNVGFYNERLARTEDNEMHYRMKQAGYKFLMDPTIITYRYSRNNFKKLVEQKYLNGYWIGKTLKESPKCFEKYHFVPVLFVASLIVSGIAAMAGESFILMMILISYLMVIGLISIFEFMKYKFKFGFKICILPVIFSVIHIVYGFGTIKGIYESIIKGNDEVEK